MTRLIGFCLAAFMAGAAAVAAGDVSEFELDNGMKAVVIEDHRAPVAVHMVWYRVGAADEPIGQSGVAHFLEHLMFKGTETRGPGEFSSIVEANGGRDNAFTSWDYTAYFQRIAVDRLELMMELEADRMANLAFRDWQTERDVILEERSQVVDSEPGRLLGEQMRATLYQNHPYGIPIIGWRHEIAALDEDDALSFYDRFYTPANAVLVVAGDVSPDEVRAMAEEHYGALGSEAEAPERARPEEPPERADRQVTLRDARVAQPYVMRYYPAPSRRVGAQDEAAALTVLAELLGGSPATSVMGRKLQFDEEVALSTSAFYRPEALDRTTFGLAVVPARGVGLDEAEAAMDRVLREFLAEGVDDSHLARIKTRIRASEIYSLDDAQRRAREYGAALTTGLTVADVQAWPEALQSVTAEDVMNAAQALFARNHVTGRLMQPEEPETRS